MHFNVIFSLLLLLRKLSPLKHYLPLTVVCWSTPTTTSQHLPLFMISVSLATSASLISFFFARMELIIDMDFPYFLARLATRTSLSYFATISFLKSIVFLAFFIKGLALGTFFGSMVAYLAVTLINKHKKQWIITKCFGWIRRVMLTQQETKADWVTNAWDALCGRSILGNEWSSHAGRWTNFVRTIFNCTKSGTKFWQKLSKTELYKNWGIRKPRFECICDCILLRAIWKSNKRAISFSEEILKV